MTYAIDVRGLTKTFGTHIAVNHMDIRVPKGKIFGFLGPNGSGKTTTLRMLCGLLTPDGGEGTCLGYNLRTESEKIKRQVGYMTQKYSFWEDLTVQENLRFVADIFGLDKPALRIQETIQTLGLEKYAGQLTGNLSGGWKQRMALAACVLHAPQLLLLDEPTAGVDPKARREFWDAIHTLAAQGLTVLVSTHYMDEAERCHEILYIANGKCITQGTVEDFIQHAGLTTWVVCGEGLMALKKAIATHPAITHIAPFGESLHISGTDAHALSQALSPYRMQQDLSWSEGTPSMEDAFVHYMGQDTL